MRVIIEQIYCDDFVYECQQMLRLQRWSTATLKTALVDAVYAVLRQLNELESIDVKFVIGKWSNDPVARAMVSDILAKHGLDDSAIEAEAFRRCSRDLIIIDQLLTSHGSRRDKALQLIAFHREMRARQRQHAAKNVVEGEVARIEQLPTTHRQGKNGH